MADAIEIQNVLVLSTAHMKLEDNNLAEEMWHPCITFTDGFFLFRSGIRDGDTQLLDAQSDVMDAFCNGYSAEFQACLEYAAALNCQFLRMDRDGPTVGHLPTFEW